MFQDIKKNQSNQLFENYYPCTKIECNNEHVYNCLELFAFMYNNTVIEKNKIPNLMEVVIS